MKEIIILKLKMMYEKTDFFKLFLFFTSLFLFIFSVMDTIIFYKLNVDRISYRDILINENFEAFIQLLYIYKILGFMIILCIIIMLCKLIKRYIKHV